MVEVMTTLFNVGALSAEVRILVVLRFEMEWAGDMADTLDIYT